MSNDPGPEPRHIDTFDENANELPNGQPAPLTVPRVSPAERERRHKLVAAAYDRYRRAIAYRRHFGGSDEAITPVAPIEPIPPIRPVREFRL